MEDDCGREQDDGDAPGPVLAAEDATPEGQESEPGHGHQSTGGDAGSQGQVLEHEVQPTAQGWGDGVEQVDHAGEEDGGGRPPPYATGPAMSLTEVGCRGPRGARRM